MDAIVKWIATKLIPIVEWAVGRTGVDLAVTVWERKLSAFGPSLWAFAHAVIDKAFGRGYCEGWYQSEQQRVLEAARKFEEEERARVKAAQATIERALQPRNAKRKR